MDEKKEKESKFAERKEKASKILQEAYQKARAQQRQRIICDQLDAGVRQRLHTYTPTKWAGKPPKLSPLAFASHGWICLSSDMVQCVSCKQYLCVLLPSFVNAEVSVYQKVVRKICSMIIMRHRVTCPYRHTTSTGTADAVPLKVLSKDVVNQRYESMKELDLEQVKLNIPEVTPPVIPETPLQKCQALIYFGWQKSKELHDAVVCTYCSRTIGLWLLRGQQIFDVDKQHYKWCTFSSKTSRYTDGWQCRHLMLQRINSSAELPSTSWAAKAEVWKSAIMPRTAPASAAP